MKSLREILQEAGYQQPEEVRPEVPQIQEPCQPQKKWLTIGDIFCGVGGLIAKLGDLITHCIGLFFWLVAIVVMLQILVRGCN